MTKSRHSCSDNTDERSEAVATLTKMLENRKQWLAACERMVELLQPEWDKFEARDSHDLYVAKTYAENNSDAQTYRKEIAALESAIATMTMPDGG